MDTCVSDWILSHAPRPGWLLHIWFRRCALKLHSRHRLLPDHLLHNDAAVRDHNTVIQPRQREKWAVERGENNVNKQQQKKQNFHTLPLIFFQITLVISSPSISTMGFETLILFVNIWEVVENLQQPCWRVLSDFLKSIAEFDILYCYYKSYELLKIRAEFGRKNTKLERILGDLVLDRSTPKRVKERWRWAMQTNVERWKDTFGLESKRKSSNLRHVSSTVLVTIFGLQVWHQLEKKFIIQKVFPSK